MAVKLRLRRMGRKKLPVWAVVAADSRKARDGRFIEDLGRYQPLSEPAVVDLKVDRIQYWLAQGAQPSDTVRNLLSQEGVLLERHLRLKGKSEEEISEAVANHRAKRQEKLGATLKETPASRRRKALEEERARAAEQEEEARKQREEAEARAKKEAEEAKRKAAQERAEAAEEARRQQEAANKAQEEADQAPAEGKTEADVAVDDKATVPETQPLAEEAPKAEAEAKAAAEGAADVAPAEAETQTDDKATIPETQPQAEAAAKTPEANPSEAASEDAPATGETAADNEAEDSGADEEKQG